MKKIGVIVFAMILSTQARATFYTGNDLIESCKNLEATCTVFMMAVADTFAMLDANENLVRYPLCIPEGITGGEMAKIMAAFLLKQPEFLGDNAAGIAHLSLFQAFPCEE